MPSVEGPLVTKNDRLTVYREALGARTAFPHQVLASANPHQGACGKQLAGFPEVTQIIDMCEVIEIGPDGCIVMGQQGTPPACR
jgi:hypothetical protein